MNMNTAENSGIEGENNSKDQKAQGAFRTISEVAEHLDVQQHVLRFWETKFSQVKPLTRGGGRRYYRPEDVEVLEKIHTILYKEGYTIKGAQKLLKGLSKRQVGQLSLRKPVPEQSNQSAESTDQGQYSSSSDTQKPQSSMSANGRAELSSRQKVILETMLNELIEIRDHLKS